MHILLVEDDPVLSNALSTILSMNGYAVSSAASVREGLAVFHSDPADLVLLDILLPDGNGIDLLQKLRPESSVPVILISALDSDPDIVRGLDAGANDYIVKPFSFSVLLARIRAASRTAVSEDPTAYLQAGLVFTDASKELSYRGTPVPLTKTEYDILSYLARRPGQLVTKEELNDAVWKYQFQAGYTNPLAVNISSIRKKLKAFIGTDLIETHFGRGYSAILPETLTAAKQMEEESK